MDTVTTDKTLLRPIEIEDIYGDNTQAIQDLGWVYDLTCYQVQEYTYRRRVRKL